MIIFLDNDYVYIRVLFFLSFDDTRTYWSWCRISNQEQLSSFWLFDEMILVLMTQLHSLKLTDNCPYFNLINISCSAVYISFPFCQTWGNVFQELVITVSCICLTITKWCKEILEKSLIFFKSSIFFSVILEVPRRAVENH